MRSSLLLALSVSLFAQTPGEVKPASIQGVFTNSITGEPLVRVRVTARGNGPVAGNGQPQTYGAVTDVEGKFRMTNVAPGTYVVQAQKTGFLMPAEYSTGRGSVVSVRPGDEKSDLKLKLIPTGAITGRVLDSSGEPMDGVTLTANGSNTSVFVNTDEQGRFRAGGLAPGRYRVCATPQTLPLPPEIRTDGTKELHHAATCYPNVLAGKATASVEVRAGADSTGIEIRLVQTPVVRISGKVFGVAPELRVSVLIRQGSSSRTSAPVKPDGSYEIWSVDPGHYIILATSYPTDGGANAGMYGPVPNSSAPVEVDVDTANVDHVDLQLMAPFDIVGQVQYEDEEARPPKPAQPPQQPGSPAAANRAPAMPRQIMLYNLDGNNGIRPVNVAEDGTFTLEKVQPDRYRMNLSWQNAFVRSVRLGPASFDDGVLDVRNGGAGLPLTVLVSSGMAEVSGKLEGDPATTAGKFAALVPEDPRDFRPRFARSPDGSYSFKVPPGRYLLLVVDESERGVISQSRGQNIEEYIGRAQKLDLRPRDKVTRDLR